MGDNPFERSKRYNLAALLREPDPQPAAKPDWAKILFRLASPVSQPQQPPPRPNPLKRLSLKPYFHVTEELKLTVWQKARPVPGSNPDWVRRDSMGGLMWFAHYGNCDEILGWEIDHIIPRSKGGTDLLPNLQPLNWQNNRRKGDTLPVLTRRPLSL